MENPVSSSAPRHRRRVTIGIAVAAALLVAHGAVWLTVTGRILDGIPAFVGLAASEGWVVKGGEPRRAGWPAAAAIHIPTVTFSRDLGGTRVVLSLDQLDLSLWPGDATRLHVDGAPHGTLRIGDGAPLDITAAEALLALPLDGTGPATLLARNLAAGPPGNQVAAALVQARIEPAAISATAGPVLVTPPLAAPFDSGAQIALRLAVAPPFPPAATPAQSATQWRSAGGRAVLDDLSVAWGPLAITGGIAGGLDPQLQPAAEGTLRITGALAVLEAASRAGLVQPGPASAIRAVLGLLTLAAQGGPVTLPVLLRDRTLSAAQFPLLRLPPISWTPGP